MKVNWKELWDANPDIFIVSGWEECPEDKRKNWHLPSQFSYFSAGDMNLRVGIIAAQGVYKEEDFFLGGILWGSRLGNGARTVMYFVAPNFSPVFLRAVAELGGPLSAKTVYWREKLTPNLFLVPENNYHNSSFKYNLGEKRPDWEIWERQLNPVAKHHLNIVKNYFESLGRRRVRVVFKKNRIAFCWGSIEIAEVKKKGNKFELNTKVKWTRNKIIASKFLKSGWVDISGQLNEEFCRTVNGILELLDNMEVNGSLDTKDLLALKLIYDKDFVPEFFGTYIDFPWLSKERSEKYIDVNQLYFFHKDNEINIVYPILEKPLNKVVNCLLTFSALEFSSFAEEGLLTDPNVRWNKKIYLLSLPLYKEELRLCHSWLREPKKFPVLILPDDWKTEGLKELKECIYFSEQSFPKYL